MLTFETAVFLKKVLLPSGVEKKLLARVKLKVCNEIKRASKKFIPDLSVRLWWMVLLIGNKTIELNVS